MYQPEYHSIGTSARAEYAQADLLELLNDRPRTSSWDDLLVRATTIALAGHTSHHVVAFDLLLEEPGALRDFMQAEFQAHPEELLE